MIYGFKTGNQYIIRIAYPIKQYAALFSFFYFSINTIINMAVIETSFRKLFKETEIQMWTLNLFFTFSHEIYRTYITEIAGLSMITNVIILSILLVFCFCHKSIHIT